MEKKCSFWPLSLLIRCGYLIYVVFKLDRNGDFTCKGKGSPVKFHLCVPGSSIVTHPLYSAYFYRMAERMKYITLSTLNPLPQIFHNSKSNTLLHNFSNFTI